MGGLHRGTELVAFKHEVGGVGPLGTVAVRQLTHLEHLRVCQGKFGVYGHTAATVFGLFQVIVKIGPPLLA